MMSNKHNIWEEPGANGFDKHCHQRTPKRFSYSQTYEQQIFHTETDGCDIHAGRVVS